MGLYKLILVDKRYRLGGYMMTIAIRDVHRNFEGQLL